MTDIAKITTAVTPLEEVDKINEVIQRANENTSAIALLEGAPTGSVMPYAGSTAPTGWLICDGSAISRTTYADLFAVIGTTYGAGDGSTTFNIPDGKIFIGSTIPVKGTGGSLGLNADGSNSGFVFQTRAYDSSPKSWSIQFQVSGGEASSSNPGKFKNVMLQTDPTKSGVCADISSGMNAVIKY